MTTENGRGLRQPALVNEAPSGLRPSGFDPARDESHVIDLDWEAWQTLVKAAAESDWIPPDYFVNDWVSDCAEFLRHGPPSPEWQPIDTAPRDEGAIIATGLNWGRGPERHVALAIWDASDHDTGWKDVNVEGACLAYLTHWLPIGAISLPPAQAIEARRAATGTGAVHESAVAASDAPDMAQGQQP